MLENDFEVSIPLFINDNVIITNQYYDVEKTVGINDSREQYKRSGNIKNPKFYTIISKEEERVCSLGYFNFRKSFITEEEYIELNSIINSMKSKFDVKKNNVVSCLYVYLLKALSKNIVFTESYIKFFLPELGIETGKKNSYKNQLKILFSKLREDDQFKKYFKNLNYDSINYYDQNPLSYMIRGHIIFIRNCILYEKELNSNSDEFALTGNIKQSDLLLTLSDQDYYFCSEFDLYNSEEFSESLENSFDGVDINPEEEDFYDELLISDSDSLFSDSDNITKDFVQEPISDLQIFEKAFTKFIKKMYIFNIKNQLISTRLKKSILVDKLVQISYSLFSDFYIFLEKFKNNFPMLDNYAPIEYTKKLLIPGNYDYSKKNTPRSSNRFKIKLEDFNQILELTSEYRLDPTNKIKFKKLQKVLINNRDRFYKKYFIDSFSDEIVSSNNKKILSELIQNCDILFKYIFIFGPELTELFLNKDLQKLFIFMSNNIGNSLGTIFGIRKKINQSLNILFV